MRRMLLVGLVALLAAVGVFYALDLPADDDSAGPTGTFDGTSGGASSNPARTRTAGLEGGRPDEPAPSPEPTDEPVTPPKAGPATLLVLAADTDVPLAQVRVETEDGSPIGVTADDGLVDFPHVPANGMDVRALRAGFFPASVRVKPGERAEVALRPGVKVSGRIVRADLNGDPRTRVRPGSSRSRYFRAARYFVNS